MGYIEKQERRTFTESVLAILTTTVLIVTLLVLAGKAFGGENNGPGGDVTCTNEVGDDLNIRDVCVNLSRTDVSVFGDICAPVCIAETDARAKAICGDVVNTCENGDFVFLTASTKAACLQATNVTQVTAQTCGDAASACDQSVVVNEEKCPDVQTTIVRCKHIKQTKAGAIRGRGCFLATEAVE